MGSFLRPVGPQPPAVYWRRRIVVVGIPLILIGLLAYSCSGSGGSTVSAGSQASASASPSAGIITPSAGATGYPPINSYPVTGPTGSPGTGASGSAGAGGSNGGSGGSGGSTGGAVTGVSGSGGCLLAVTVQLDKTAPNGNPVYPAGQNPTFSVILHNQGSANCRFDVSGKGVVVTVASVDNGGKQVWTSATCAGPTDLRVLGPGDGYTEQVPWGRQPTPSSCPPPTNALPVLNGAYAVAASVSGVASATVQFQLQ